MGHRRKADTLTGRRPSPQYGPSLSGPISPRFGANLPNSRGETLVETLASLLIIVSALLILAGGISTGARVNKEADTRYAVVFPPPMEVGLSAFTYVSNSSAAAFRLNPPGADSSLAEAALYEELRDRLSGAAEGLSAEGGTEEGVDMKPIPVRIRKTLAVDRNKRETTWRVLYVFELAEENGGVSGDAAGDEAETP